MMTSAGVSPEQIFSGLVSSGSLLSVCMVIRFCTQIKQFPTGSRIIYDRKFLLHCRNSPLARTPPSCLPQIPGVTMPVQNPLGKLEEQDESSKDLAGKTAKAFPSSSSLW